ncbi:unnamed protein product [Amaranthus hypochondriacus]
MSASVSFYSSNTILIPPLNPSFLPYSHGIPSKISYSCKLNNNTENDSSQISKTIGIHKPRPNNTFKFDRRNMILIGLGSVCGSTITPFPDVFSGTLGLAAPVLTARDLLPRKLDSTIRALVARGRKSRSKNQKQDEEEEEVLNVKFELLETDKYVKFDVFINEEDDNPSKMRLMSSEYAGSFVCLPHSHKANKGYPYSSSLMLGLTDLIEELGVDDDDTVEVVLVPRAGLDAVLITDINIGHVS